jgi:HAMP domain-containing protein
MNEQQLQALVVLALAMFPVALLWWAWLRLLPAADQERRRR